jgi:pyruvate kinase
LIRRTRIVATLGPATDREGVLEQLLQGGLDVARINFSHGQAEEHLRRIGRLRELATLQGRNVAVLGDLPGPKLRVLLSGPMELVAGQKVSLGRRKGEGDLQLTEPEALGKVTVGQRVLLDDGRMQGRVVEVNDQVAAVSVEVGGTLQPNKGCNLPDTDLDIPAVTERDRLAIELAAQAGVDWLALSFVREAGAVQEVRHVARSFHLDVPVLAKMERPEAVKRAGEIINAFDGIMVARGDLGVEIALEKVPHVQKRLIFLARAAGKPVITATDMLDSMRSNPRPTRAEASDVANAVYDGTDAVMLSGETAVGQYPVAALTCMNNILREAETHMQNDAPRGIHVPPGEVVDHITELTCKLARDIKAQAIIAPTLGGRTARMVARHRPGTTIVAPATEEKVLRQMALFWGVCAVPLPMVLPGEDRLTAAVRASFQHGVVRAGDRVVVLAGHPIEGGERFPTIRVVKVGETGESLEP